MDRLARRVAAAWSLKQAQGPTPPAIPDWVFTHFQSRYALVPDEGGARALILEAKESINLALPRFIKLLRKEMGDRYYANSSTRRMELYYFFSPRHPLDTFSVYVRPAGNEKVLMVVGYMPMDLKGRPDLAHSIEMRGPAMAPSAGFVLMMLAKRLLQKINT